MKHGGNGEAVIAEAGQQRARRGVHMRSTGDPTCCAINDITNGVVHSECLLDGISFHDYVFDVRMQPKLTSMNV
jgi:hypothetical protein